MKYFDLHCDTLTKLFLNKKDLAVFPNSCFEEYRQVFAIFIEEDDKTPYLTYKNMVKIPKKQGVAKLLSLENALPIENDLSRIEEIKNDGVRSVMLTWNNQNKYAGGAYSDGDVTEFGKQVIKEMNKNNIALDVSHLNEKSFFTALSLSEKVLASHSNCKAIKPHIRNLSDEQIRAIIKRNGIIGINFYPEFLGDDMFHKIYLNICHISELGGEKNICIGSDFDGALMDNRLDNVEKVPDLYEYLKLKNLSEKFLTDVFYNNANAFYKNI